MSGKNVGDLLNAKNVTWGWFQGGFKPTRYNRAGTAVCGAHHVGLAGDDAGTTSGDYIPHHEPFQYYKQTANPHHLPPTSVASDRQGRTRPIINTTSATSSTRWRPAICRR